MGCTANSANFVLPRDIFQLSAHELFDVFFMVDHSRSVLYIRFVIYNVVEKKMMHKTHLSTGFKAACGQVNNSNIY